MTPGDSGPAPRGSGRPAAGPDRGWLTRRWLGLVEALLRPEGSGAARSTPGESLAIHPGRIEAQFPGRPAQAFVTTAPSGVTVAGSTFTYDMIGDPSIAQDIVITNPDTSTRIIRVTDETGFAFTP